VRDPESQSIATLIVETMHKNTQVFPCPLEATLEPPTHSKGAVLFSWQLLGKVTQLFRRLGQNYQTYFL
jgi:hypothetical protein